MFYGTYGVGKTVSLILYSILMNNVCNYALTIDKQIKNQLSFQNLLVFPMMKPIYWSFKQIDESDIKEIILDQCPEIYHNDNTKYQ